MCCEVGVPRMQDSEEREVDHDSRVEERSIGVRQLKESSFVVRRLRAKRYINEISSHSPFQRGVLDAVFFDGSLAGCATDESR